MPESAFLFLHGPHGPLFKRLARQLVARGAGVRRVLFNSGDHADWSGDLPSAWFTGPEFLFRDWLIAEVSRHGITDLVLYGTTQPNHRIAIDVAEGMGVSVHVIGEGYLAPGHVTYERSGCESISQLAKSTLADMADLIEPQESRVDRDRHDGESDCLQCWWCSFRYYLHQLRGDLSLSGHRRNDRVLSLFGNHLWAGLMAPLRRGAGGLRQGWVLRSGRVYHLVILRSQDPGGLNGSSDRAALGGFLKKVIEGFAEASAADELLVIQLDPLDQGRSAFRREIRELARARDLSQRIVLVDALRCGDDVIDGARSVLAPGPREADQALHRGVPVAIDGDGFSSELGVNPVDDLASFILMPERPDRTRYWLFRRFLTSTSQFAGACYSPSGLRQLLAHLPQAMLAEDDPYTACSRRAKRRLAATAFPAPPDPAWRRIEPERLH